MSDSTIVIPFAENGDKQAIPQSAQPSGTVSFDQGYTSNYSDPGSSQYVERTALNENLHTVYSHLKILQNTGFDRWRNDVNYDLNAMVWHDGNVWQKQSAGQGTPAASSPWVKLTINDLAPKNNPALTGIVTVPTSTNTSSAVNNDRMETYVASRFNLGSNIYRGYIVTHALSSNNDLPASTYWVKAQNYASTADVTNLSNNAVIGTGLVYNTPTNVSINSGAGINNVFPDALSKKSEIKRIVYLSSGLSSIALRIANQYDTTDPVAVMFEVGPDANFLRIHVQKNSWNDTNDRTKSQTYAVLSRVSQPVLTSQVATTTTVTDMETSILRKIKNFIAKNQQEFDMYNNDARFQLVTASQNKNLRYVTQKSQVGTTIGSDDAIVVSHTHTASGVTAEASYPSDGSPNVGTGKIAVEGTVPTDPRNRRLITTGSTGDSGVGKNIPTSFCVAMFEFIG
jgi:hypothetical protein